MSLQRCYDGCGDVPEDFNSVNLSGFPEIRRSKRRDI